MTLSDVTVVGAVIAGGTKMQLHNVNVFQNPKGVQFEFEQGFVGRDESVGMRALGVDPRFVVVKLKKISGRPARPSDFAPPRVFDPNQDLVAVYQGTEDVAGPVSQYTGSGSPGGRFLAALQKQIPNTPIESGNSISGGKINLDLNQFLKLADKIKLVYRRTYYGIPSDPTGTS